MKTTYKKIAFHKNTILELGDDALLSINGGSTIAGGPTCSGCICLETQKELEFIANNQGQHAF